jgi:serine protease Do
MDFPERSPCPSCAEPVALEARICPHCRRSVLVDLRLDGPVSDARLRYQAARALGTLGGPFLAVGVLQQAMSRPRPRVAGGLTRAQALAAGGILAQHGLHASVAPDPSGAEASGRALKAAGLAALGVAALALATWWLSRPARPSPGVGARGAAPAPGTAAPAPAVAPELARKDLARIALASTASVRCADSVGAGFFVADGLLLTNAHVLCRDGSAPKVVLADGREASGSPLRRDEALDLALLSVAGLSARPMPLGDGGAVAVGDRVMMVGSPVGMDFTVHEGMVSAVGRVVLGNAYIQLDAKVNPGNSGGPILDTSGRAVGIVSLKRTDAEGIALALPINYAWTGLSPMIEPPAGQSAGFEDQLARARQEDEALAAEVGSAELRPLLLGLGMNSYRQHVARVLLPARGQPYYTEFAFKVWKGEDEVCSLTASVSEWTPVEAPAVMRANPRLQAWLDRHGLSAQLYLGDAPVRLDLCALQPGVQLELRGAEPEASRLLLR